MNKAQWLNKTIEKYVKEYPNLRVDEMVNDIAYEASFNSLNEEYVKLPYLPRKEDEKRMQLFRETLKRRTAENKRYLNQITKGI